MIFAISKDKDSSDLTPVATDWAPKELELERFVLPNASSDAPILNETIFGEPLLLVSNQVTTRNKKRADILALDRQGNGVIVELKRDRGSLGVETQALQYLADFSSYQGMDFIDHFSKYNSSLKDDILGFIGDAEPLEELNRRSRIILMARGFDPSIFSMGKWLSDNGVAFRCVAYTPVEIHGDRFLSFSLAFDQSNRAIYPLSFQTHVREPEVYWHNIGEPKDFWWSYLTSHNKISANYGNRPGDQGEQLLKSFIRGDQIVAYAGGHGAVGWGTIKNPQSYTLLNPGDKEDLLNGHYLHRLDIQWRATADTLSNAIPSAEIRERFDIYHPVSTSVRIKRNKAERLIKEMNERFSSGA